MQPDSTGLEDHAHPAPAVAEHVRRRLSSIDIARGLVIVLMVLDHTRDFVGSSSISPTDPKQTYPLLFFTRWVTHFCAPTFIFLAGTSAYLLRQRVSGAELRRFLLSRGLWLVLLELTVVRFAWTFDLTYHGGLILQVIWAIGASMCALAGLTLLPARALLLVGVTMVAAHNLLDAISPVSFGAWAPLWNLVHVQGVTWFGFVVYPVVPWIGVMSLGYSAGAVYELAPERRRLRLIALGLSSSAAFLVLRSLNAYGDPQPWSVQTALWRSALSFLNVSKYPPSLDYVLMTLGPMLVVLALLERADGTLTRGLRTIGQVPLFAYVVHLLIVHTLAGLIGLLGGRGLSLFGTLFSSYPADWGFGLAGVYLTWLLVLALLYPACAWFALYKQTHRTWWVAYL
ncbi:MAG: hypothetical protein JWN48_4775 [Myxococcaceae bacterium]|nr:hypothetical protein [Myxococcaceae bacterium]